MNPTLVLGHLNPDTDTTGSAIAYAWYLSTQKNMPAEAAVTGQLNKETLFVLEYFKIAAPRLITELTTEDNFVLVDTNNPDELVSGHEKANLLEVVDHHKLVGGLHTSQPISFTLRPVACTCTVLADIMKGVELPREIAGVMLACILSDTLNFSSPTTTEQDRAVAQSLIAQTGIDPDELAQEMFAAKSDLSGLFPQDIVTFDSKIYPIGDKKVRISVVETTLPAKALEIRQELEKALKESKENDGLAGAFLFIVNIITGNATLIVPSDDERHIAETAFKVSFTGETVELPGIVSRKKQMAPFIENAFNQS